MLSIRNISKLYDDQAVLNGIDMDLAFGEVICIIGPSGGGKSTILRMINQLEPPSSGDIKYDGIKLKDITMVFQSFNLFNNMSVLNNVVYPLIKVHKMKKANAIRHAESALSIVGMKERKDFMPNQLSGGQKQRTAIARAVANHPKLILFDEPTSALDPENVAEVLNVIKKLSGEDIAMLIVTHEIKFAAEVADKIAFVENGRILEITETKKFFKEPRTKRAQLFLKKVL